MTICTACQRWRVTASAASVDGLNPVGRAGRQAWTRARCRSTAAAFSARTCLSRGLTGLGLRERSRSLHRGHDGIGSEALQIARIEAGFIQAGADFVPAEQEVRSGRSRSPYELGLGWLVHLKKPHFNGKQALQQEKRNGSRYRFVKLDVQGNKPAEHSFIYNRHNKVVGTVTSAAWVPTAKRNIAFASLEMPWGKPGDELKAEIYYLRELKWNRVMEKCTVVEGAVFDPQRRHATPALDQ